MADKQHTPEFLACYSKESYGRGWAPVAPDYSRCCAATWGHVAFDQCSRKNGHGPHGAYCKQHDPVAVKAKQEARNAKWDKQWDINKRKTEFAAECQSAIRAIAAGHNDPRALAQSIIDKLEKP